MEKYGQKKTGIAGSVRDYRRIGIDKKKTVQCGQRKFGG